MLKHSDIRDLLAQAPEQVLSLYLRVDRAYQPNQSETPAWRIHLKNAMSAVEEQFKNSKSISENVTQFFENYSPSSKSLVIFAGEDDYLESFELPIAIESNHTIGEIDVVSLLWAIDEYERYLVALVDVEQARFLSAYLGRADTSDEMEIDFDDYDFREQQFVDARGTGGDGFRQSSGGENFEDMKREHVRRFHSDIAERIRDLADDMGAERIILGGNEKAAHQVKDLLHDTMKNKVVDILPVPLERSDSEVAEAIEDAALNYERSHEHDLVNEVINLAKSGGRGALGVEDIRQALKMQQVELLVLPYPMDDEALAAELTLEVLNSGGEIELVHGSAASLLQQEAEVGARLYYQIAETQ